MEEAKLVLGHDQSRYDNWLQLFVQGKIKDDGEAASSLERVEASKLSVIVNITE